MKLSALAHLVSELPLSAQALDARDLRLDSRSVQSGDVFIALQGDTQHGIRYAAQTLERGAVFVLTEPCNDEAAKAALAALPTAHYVVSANLRAKLGTIAQVFYRDAASRLRTIGVTGTNGKTSITQLLARALQTLSGRAVASIGTLGSGLIDALHESERTTPDVLTLHQAIAEFVEVEAIALVMEVSSHALAQQRVAGLQFKGAIFSNLTRDHLDYHGSMQAYAQAKAKLFQWPSLEYVVLNADAFEDPAELAAFIPDTQHSRAKVFRYSLFADRGADVYCKAVRAHTRGSTLEIAYQNQRLIAELGLLGEFNVSNALAVLTALIAEGYTLNQLAAIVPAMQPVNGRMNALHVAGSPSVVIDYAHTPDALEKALLSLRKHVPSGGKLICVFGCGGDRDTGKRALMGAIAVRLADQVIITSDNPRSESPEAIAAAIQQGIPADCDAVLLELDRQRAIELAVNHASSNDLVLIAGKGHERYQEISGVRFAFDDREQALQAMRARGNHAHAA